MFQGRPRRDDYLEIIDKVDSPLQTQFSPCPWNAHCWNSIKKNSSLTLTKDSVSKSNPKRGMLPNQRNMAALVFVQQHTKAVILDWIWKTKMPASCMHFFYGRYAMLFFQLARSILYDRQVIDSSTCLGCINATEETKIPVMFGEILS